MGIPKFVYVHKIIAGIIEKDIEKCMQATEEILEDGKDLINFLWEMIKHTKDILMYKVSKKIDIYNEEEKKQIGETAEKVSKEELINIIYKLSELENKMRMSSQKTIIFETEIIKLCIKMDISGLEDRVTNLEKKIENGEINVKSNSAVEIPKIVKQENYKIEKAPKEEPKEKEEQKEKQQIENIKQEKKKETKIEPPKITISEGTTIKEWQTVLKKIKEQGKVIIYANLINTEAIIVNDMTVAIRFNNGLTDFRQKLLTQPDNLNLLTKEISIICGKPMQVKFEDTKGAKIAKASVTKKEEAKQEKELEKPIEDADLAGLINYIEEE